MKPKYPLILWTDNPAAAKPLRDAQPVKTVIRDSLMFDGSVEPAEAIAFWGATNRLQIIEAYSAHGITEVHDFPVEIAEPEYLPKPADSDATSRVELTGVEAEIAAMSDDEVRQNLEKLTGEKPHHAKKRETLITELKAALA